MSLNIGRALQEGIARTVARNGLLLVAVMGVIGAVNTLAYNSAMASVFSDLPDGPAAMLGPTLPISPTVAGVATAVLYLATFVLTAVALRTFVTDETRRIPREYVTRNLGWFLVNYVVGYVVFLVAVVIGSALLFVPGIFLLVSLYFWFVLVAVEDQNFVAAFRNSWSLTRGHRWSLLGLGLTVMVVGMVVYGVLFGVALVTPPTIVLLVYAIVGAALGVFVFATTARAYVQLTEEDAAFEAAAVA